jgi:ATP-dependent Clp protease adaptor protein ClpS
MVIKRNTMSNDPSTPVLLPGVKIENEEKVVYKNAPRWNVILLDGPNHTFAFVTEIIIQIFKRNMDDAKALTEEVHRMGRAIVVTCSKERAELYLEQVRSFGNDPFMKIFYNKESGPMSVTMEPSEE